MDRTDQDNLADIKMLLRDYPKGTTANIAEYLVVYWDGHQLRGAHLTGDNPPELDEEFDPEEVLSIIPEVVAAWLQTPSFSYRTQVLTWLEDSPPIDAGL